MKPDPRSILRSIRNVKRGIEARSKIIYALKNGEKHVKSISSSSGLSYSAVRMHLKRMLREGIVTRDEKKPYKWKLTGRGQTGIYEYT
ncbi:MAG: ArsR family transcriptional regulator [Candidatus Nezhaarchaeales archaeon]